MQRGFQWIGDLCVRGRSVRSLHLESPGMNTWGLCIGDDCLEQLQQVALPGRKMGDFVFDRSRAMNSRCSHLFFVQVGQEGFKLIISGLDVVEQDRLCYRFRYRDTSSSLQWSVFFHYSPESRENES